MAALSVPWAVFVVITITAVPADAAKSTGDCAGIESLIVSKGYPFERHDVVTEDGYIIELHRIPAGRQPCPEPCRRQPVFLMTGLAADSSVFVLDYPKQSLGYVLADSNYDVWLGNVRGNTYGKRHESWTPKEKRFWTFSVHEHGTRDAPAQIDYILKETKRSSLLYVGLSQGTLIFFIMMSEKPEYNDKVKAFAGLAPFNKLAHLKVPSLTFFAPLAEGFLRAIDAAGQHEVLPRGSSLSSIVIGACVPPVTSICSFLAERFVNVGSRYINESRIPTYLCHIPAGTSMKNIIYYDQMVKSKRPQKFDYGTSYNRDYYDQPTPPEYKLSNVKTDVGVFWSLGDQFIAPEDVRELIQELGPRVKMSDFIDDPFYTHAHFAVSLVNPAYLHKGLLEFLRRYPD